MTIALRQRLHDQAEQASEAVKMANEARENAELAVEEANQALNSAQAFVERVKLQASSGQGGWWWASREIEDSKRFLPQKQQRKMMVM